MEYRVLSLGDSAITFEWTSGISQTTSRHIAALHLKLKQQINGGELRECGIIETAPAFRSLTCYFDPLKILPSEVAAALAPFLNAPTDDKTNDKINKWQIPLCCENDFAADLDYIAAKTKLSTAEVLEIYFSKAYNIFMLGFMAGFAFMGETDPRLHLPRRQTPRTAVPKGAAAIANQLTAIYPAASPGGWHLVGQTPIELFFPDNETTPCLFGAGDEVNFVPISSAEFAKINNSDYDPQKECKR